MLPPNGHSSLVIAERGSAWDRWLGRGEVMGLARHLVVQDRLETDADFAQRVRGHLAKLGAEGRMPRRVVLVGGRARDSALSARSLMIRAIAHGMAQGGGGELLLDNHASDRFTMRALADTVSDMVRGSGVQVAHVADDQPAASRARLRQVA